MHTIAVRLRFDSGHRLPNHPGLCRYPHGHSYLAEAMFEADTLGEHGWVLDFSDAKARLRDVLSKFDHAFILDSRDGALIDALSSLESSRLYIMQDSAPTAEALAREIFRLAQPTLPSLAAIRVWETEHQYAEYRPPSPERP